MDINLYTLKNTGDLISPALIYYKDIILNNTKRIIQMAGGPEKLWPHVKSHKTAEIIRMQTGLGISRFKCATIAEAEMTAEAGGTHIILAYPLVGPNIARYLQLAKAYPDTVFYAIGDNMDQLALLAREARSSGTGMNVLVDVDIGMHRTGVPLESVEIFYEQASALQGIHVKGMHCYDGHIHERDINQRRAIVEEIDRKILKIRDSLRDKKIVCDLLVMGGTPTFPCRTGKNDFYLSPGTLFIGDWGYSCNLPDLAFTPGAAVFCRVVSRQPGNTFTIDLGNKGIAADPAGARGVIAGLEEAKPLFQSEEHWVFSLPAGNDLPPVGSSCYVIPAHICPTSALYPEILIAQENEIRDNWKVSARNRRIRF